MLRAVYQKYRGIDGSPINVSQVAFWHSYLSQTKEIEDRRKEARLFSLRYRLKAEEILEDMRKTGLYSHHYVYREKNLFQIAKTYKDGIYVTQDLKKAEHYFYLALREGSDEALGELGNLVCKDSPDEHYAQIIDYYSNCVINRRINDELLPKKERDPDRDNLKLRGISWAMKRIDSPLVQFELGSLYHSDGEYEEAIKWLLRSATAQPRLETFLVLAYSYDEMGEDAKAFNWWVRTLNSNDHEDIHDLWFYRAFSKFLKKICDKYPLFKPIFEVEGKAEKKLLYRPISLCNSFILNWEENFPEEGMLISDFFLEKVPADLSIPEAFHSHSAASEILVARNDYLGAVKHLFVALENLSTTSLDDDDLDINETEDDVIDFYINTTSRTIGAYLFCFMSKEDRLRSNWWKYIEESKEPERYFVLLEDLLSRYIDVLKELPESVILNLFEKTECWRIFDSHSEISLEKLFPGISVLAKSHLPSTLR